jgi:hypothetical protein
VVRGQLSAFLSTIPSLLPSCPAIACGTGGAATASERAGTRPISPEFLEDAAPDGDQLGVIRPPGIAIVLHASTVLSGRVII